MFECLVAVCGAFSQSYATVKTWAREFQLVRENPQDDTRSRKISTSITPVRFYISLFLIIVVLKVVETGGISYGFIERALHDLLHMSQRITKPTIRIVRPVKTDQPVRLHPRRLINVFADRIYLPQPPGYSNENPCHTVWMYT